MNRIETRTLKREIARHLIKKNCCSKCKFLYFKEDRSYEYMQVSAYDAIVMLNYFKIEKLVIITDDNNIAINEIPLIIKYDKSEYSEINLNP